MTLLDPFIRFLNRCPTVYHAAEEIGAQLRSAGFTQLREQDKWTLEAGKGYFVIRDGSLAAAFRLPKNPPASAVLLASHIDSPALKIKPHPEAGAGQFITEMYGGPLLHTWLDRDLVLAGRIHEENGSRIVFLDDCPMIIPGLAIHLQKEVNEKGLILNKQDHLKAVYTLQTNKKRLDACLSFDLFLVPLEKAAFLGFDKELIASYRLDNLTSAFACLYALVHAKEAQERLQMALFWDHEEIGSKTYGGADSLFVDQLLERICKMDREECFRVKSRSLCISSDVSHAFHPNFPEKYDPQNAPLMGKGPVLKFSAKCATNGSTAAPIVRLAAKQNIPLQTFASRSDIPGGGTVGAMMGANLGIPTVDIGIGCWSMHSIRETIAADDEVFLCKLLQAALENL